MRDERCWKDVWIGQGKNARIGLDKCVNKAGLPQ